MYAQNMSLGVTTDDLADNYTNNPLRKSFPCAALLLAEVC